VPGVLSISSIALFFGGHSLVQLGGWDEMPLVLSGLLLLPAEIFIIRGFGIAEILGIAALLSGLSLSLIGGGASWDFIFKAVSRVIFSLLVTIVEVWSYCAFYACRSASDLS